MTRLTALMATLLSLHCMQAHACLRGQPMPEYMNLGKYSEVRVVQVTGVHLTAFENNGLVTRGAEPRPDEGEELEYFYPTSSTPGFEVRALVDRTIKGPDIPLVKVALGGCKVKPPKLKERGIVFVPLGGGYAIAVWEHQEGYLELLKYLGAEPPAEDP